ncbi:MAG: acyltransferase, partial [Rikenellaceae bacterium]|nr:acyltransferase [Rikenellaceae bacterium]
LMRVLVRDAANPTDVKSTGRGGINIIDLASRDSVAFIATGDVGAVAEDGSFVIEGRIAHSDIRGCNLLVQ